MERLIIIKSREGLLYKQLLDTQDLTIGRAYNNDVIINDPYIEPYQLAIKKAPQGDVILSVQASTNTVLINGDSVGAGDFPVRQDTVVKIGHTDIEIRDVSFTLLPAKKMMHLGNLSNLRHLVYSLAALLFTSFIVVQSHFLSSVKELAFKSYYQELLGLFMIVITWAAFWSLISRILVHRGHFSIHLIVGCFLVFLGFLSDVIAGFTGWALTEYLYYETLQILMNATMVFIILMITLSIATNLARPSRWAGTFSLLLILTSFTYQLMDDKHDFMNESYLGNLMPPIVNISGLSVSEFTVTTTGVFAELEEMVKEHEEEIQSRAL